MTKLDKNEIGNVDNFLTLTNLQLTLSLIKSLSKIEPGLFFSICYSLLQLLDSTSFRTFKDTTGIQRKTIHQISSFFIDIIKKTLTKYENKNHVLIPSKTKEEASMALSTLFAVGVS